jgi:excisionase family DNA binding protein
MANPKKFLSLEEVAELLSVNYQLIYRLVRSGDLPAARIGRVYRVDETDLNEYLQRSKTARPGSGGVCSACGKTYQSRTSLRNECSDCGEPLCLDCWTRRGVRRCSEHAEEDET